MGSKFSFILVLFPFMHLSTFSFKIYLTVQEHEELIWLAGNLKLKLIEYSWQLYNGKDVGDDDDDGGGDDNGC